MLYRHRGATLAGYINRGSRADLSRYFKVAGMPGFNRRLYAVVYKWQSVEPSGERKEERDFLAVVVADLLLHSSPRARKALRIYGHFAL